MYGLSAADLEIQNRARAFVDELIPYEEEAESNGGRLPVAVEKAHHERAIALGLHAARERGRSHGPGQQRSFELLPILVADTQHRDGDLRFGRRFHHARAHRA